jgi:hypothetical protein
VGDNRNRAFDDPKWTLPAVLAWIVTRNSDWMAEIERLPLYKQGMRVAVDQGLGRQPRIAIRQAENELWTALKKGKLTATAVTTSTKARVDVPPSEWFDLELTDLDPTDTAALRHKRDPWPVRYQDVLIGKAAVTRQWPEREIVDSAALESKCRRWLVQSAQNSSEESKKKEERKAEAQKRFPGISDRAIERAWSAASKEVPALSRAGRPSKKSPH